MSGAVPFMAWMVPLLFLRGNVSTLKDLFTHYICSHNADMLTALVSVHLTRRSSKSDIWLTSFVAEADAQSLEIIPIDLNSKKRVWESDGSDRIKQNPHLGSLAFL